jgi:eukaryotic-like serine/threonine-protein kinase
MNRDDQVQDDQSHGAISSSKSVLTVLLLAALFGFSALVVFYLSLRGRTVKVPNIVSLKEAVAQDELEDNGLIMQVRGRAPHQQIPFGAVADQSPAAGTVVKTGQLVRVTLSTGMPPPEPGRN